MAEINGGYCYYLLTNWDDPPSGVVWPVLVGRKVEEGLSWKAPQMLWFCIVFQIYFWVPVLFFVQEFGGIPSVKLT